MSLVVIIVLLQRRDMFTGPSLTRNFETEEKQEHVTRKLCCLRSDFVLKTGNKPINLYIFITV